MLPKSSQHRDKDQMSVALYNWGIVVPISQIIDILKRIHIGYLGIHKCREWAHQSVWWPGLLQDIAEMAKTCRTCQNHQPQRQCVATDLSYFKNDDYLLAVDYYSRYIEFFRLTSMTSTAVINSMKYRFARHGIPEIVISDNGPCYASQEYRKSGTNYCFESMTSSPWYPQAHGEAEKCVQTV